MRLFVIVLLLPFFIFGEDIDISTEKIWKSCEKYNKLNKYDYFTELMRSSNFEFDKWRVKAKQVNLLIDENTIDSIIGSLYLPDNNISMPETGLSVIGWVEYNMTTEKLFDITASLENAKELQYNKEWSDVINTVFLEKKLQFIIVKEKSFLYSNTKENCRSEKFLIKNDCALIVNESQDQWYKIYFYHPQWKTSTIMWIKADDIIRVK